jgi:hypothetical protein
LVQWRTRAMDVLDFAREPVWVLQRGDSGADGLDWGTIAEWGLGGWWVELRFC